MNGDGGPAAEVEARVSKLFQIDLVTIVGSGWACGHGLPSMSELASELLDTVPNYDEFEQLPEPDREAWEGAASALSETADIEQALNGVLADSALIPLIERAVAGLVGERERVALGALIDGGQTSDFGDFIRYLSRVGSPISVVTTNYDRLLEFSARMAGFFVDDMFAGSHFGSFDAGGSRNEQRVWGTARGRQTLTSRPHIRLFKPHGSLDWFEDRGGRVFRTEMPNSARRKIVTPGSAKLAAGYHPLFDTQRSGANRAIREASGFLVLGFGFNDSHLQTYLSERLRSGAPALILTKSLSDTAKQLISEMPEVWGISEGPTNQLSTLTTSAGEFDLGTSYAWQLSTFLSEILHFRD